jgi:D-galactarolactone cycloisomerase
MKIAGIETIGLAFTLHPEQADDAAGHTGDHREVTLVRVKTEDGIEGIGEARGSFDLMKTNIDVLARAFLGTDIIERDVTIGRFRALDQGARNGALVAAYSGLNIAMLDALGKALKLPVCRLIGGMARSEVTGCAAGADLTHGPASRYEEQLERIRAAKMPFVKIGVGLGPVADEKRVALARRYLGDSVAIAVDANANYTAEIALESMNRIAPYRIAWYAEALEPLDFAGYAQLRSRAPVAIAAGAAHSTAHDFRMLLDGGCIDIARPSACGCGGLDEARRIADLCRLNSTRLTAAAGASGVGFAAAVHFAASIPRYPHSEYEATPQLVECDVADNPAQEGVLAERLRFNGGNVVVPDRPGLGIELNHDFIKHHAVA